MSHNYSNPVSFSYNIQCTVNQSCLHNRHWQHAERLFKIKIIATASSYFLARNTTKYRSVKYSAESAQNLNNTWVILQCVFCSLVQEQQCATEHRNTNLVALTNFKWSYTAVVHVYNIYRYLHILFKYGENFGPLKWDHCPKQVENPCIWLTYSLHCYSNK